MNTERAKMLAGELYLASDPELVQLRRRARRLTRAFNASPDDDPAQRAALLRDLLAHCGQGVEIEPLFQCDYGFNIRLADRVYMNFGCVLLDCAPITIGEGTLLGPGVHLYAATHPTDPALRRSGRERAKPITIGSNAWIGGGAIICPGVTIADDAVVGAGSVVTRDVPKGAVVVGNPGRVVPEKP